MSDTAPLIVAHDHVRKATQEFQRHHRSQAGEQYQQASNDFARAARGTNDSEALRVLNLLEEQHRRLAQLIRDQDTAHQDSTSTEPKPVAPLPVATSQSSEVAPPNNGSATPKPTLATTNNKNARVNTQQRDSSPSLAREIASRRGIPSAGKTTQAPVPQSRARRLSPESKRESPARSIPQLPPSIIDSQADLRKAALAKRAADDEGFAKFYSNLTTGTMSKLSSVLAYAGLPLTADETAAEERQQRCKRTVSAGNEPDVKKIFSKAALDAIEDEHRQRGTLGHGFGPTESFYVVQKGGGTYSYADIARAHHRQLSGVSVEEDDAEFVDAKEVQGQMSPKQSRFKESKRDSFGNPRTNEELDLENATLKETLQNLASRLSVFEAHAQDASFAALTQSVANIRPQGGTDVAMQERIRQLEKEVENQAEDRQKLESLASKQEKTLKKYQSKFEELKKSAREREKAKKDRVSAGEQTADAAEAG